MNAFHLRDWLRPATGDIQTLGGTGGGGGGGLVSPLTTKGDIWGWSTTNARVPVGSDGTVLTADSTQTLGVKYAAVATPSYSTTTIVTSGSQATIHFPTISGSFKNARITITGRDTSTTVDNALVHMMFNSDATSGNYSNSVVMAGSGSVASSASQASSAAGGVCCEISGSLNNVNTVSSAIITIAGYSGAVFRKQALTLDCENYGASGLQVANRYFTWANTVAITDIVITAGATAFVDGTTATLELFG